MVERPLDGTVVGDHYNIECPWCGKNNVYITQGIKTPFNVIRVFEKPCHWCEKPVVYQAEWSIKVRASQKGADDQLNFIFNQIQKNKSSNRC